MAEFEGKRYKIVLDLRVFTFVDENNPHMPPPSTHQGQRQACVWLIQF